MMRLSNFVWMVVIVVAVFMLYKVKYQVQALQQEIAATSQQLRQEREALRVTSAEWAYLNRPERLQKLATKYLASTDVTVNQIAEIEEIPFPSQSMAALDNSGIKPVSLSALKPSSGGRR
ncbi:MAG: hypothetical protein EBV03_02625 [Proteobacteria bacterium]|nr:hypothetical protein [Pseudomonadota bacterium]